MVEISDILKGIVGLIGTDAAVIGGLWLIVSCALLVLFMKVDMRAIIKGLLAIVGVSTFVVVSILLLFVFKTGFALLLILAIGCFYFALVLEA
ncbi:MAG: hypothetical protein ACREQ2_26075 [Candidatus Binatia bacterium]